MDDARKRILSVFKPGRKQVLAGLLVLELMLAGLALLAPAATAFPVEWSDTTALEGPSWPTGPLSIAVDGSRVYVSWTDTHNASDVVYRRYSNGMWGSVGTVHTAQTTSAQTQGDIAAADGVMHAVWTDKRDGDEDIFYRYTLLKGWSTEMEVSDDSTNEVQRQPAIAVDEGIAHIVWTDLAQGRSEIYYRSYDGTVWSTEVQLSDGDTGVRKYSPDITVENGAVHVVWAQGLSGKTVMYKRNSRNVWGSQETVSTGGGDAVTPKLAVEDGTAYVVYGQENGVASDILIRTRTPAGVWSDVESVSPVDSVQREYAPDIGVEAGHVYVVYYQYYTSDNYIRLVENHGTGWQRPVAVDNTEPGMYQKDPVVAVANGKLHIAWNYVLTEFDFDIDYRVATMDGDIPQCTLTSLDSFWLDSTGTDVHWSASDNYALDSVVLMYNYSADHDTWTGWRFYDSLDVRGSRHEAGAFSFVPSDGEGFYKFQAYSTDVAGNVSDRVDPAILDAAFDTTPPTGTLTIDDGADWANSADVTLAVTFSDAMSELNWTGTGPVPFMVRYSDDGVLDDEPWEAYDGPRDWEMASTGADVRVHCQVRDSAGLVSTAFSDTIGVDVDPPTGNITIDAGAASSVDSNVTLSTQYSDALSGVDMVRYSNDGVWDDEPWEAPNFTREWQLAPGDGVRTVHFQVRDKVGHLSDTFSDSITVDTVKPTVGTTEPADGAKDVDPTGNITVTFSEPMDRASTEAAFKLEPEGGGDPITGTFTWSPDNRTLTFDPTEDLGKGKKYTVTVGPSAKDAAGNAGAGEADYTFSTSGGKKDDSPAAGGVAALAVLAVTAVVRGRRRRWRPV